MNFKIILSTALLASLILASCSNQRMAVSETDDIYYSSSDRFADADKDFNQVKEVSGEDYKSNDSYSSNYYSVGKEEATGQNQRAEGAYAESQATNTEADQNSQGATVNNFYGNTTYSEGDYYEEDYASRIRRFDETNFNGGYGYYDPYFVNPNWNYGWSSWNSFPGGWNVGYSSYSGWNVGYNWGAGYGRPWYTQPLWYRYRGGAYWDYWSYGYPRSNFGNCYGPYGPYYGGYGGYAGGYGGYNNGYWNGYGDGFYDGAYSNNGNNRRPSYNGRRPVAGSNGFSDNANTGGRRDVVASDRLQSVSTVGAPRASEYTASNDKIGSSAQSSEDRLASAQSIYQSNNASVKDRQNANAQSAATKYGKT
ncbi:MAG TPA: hypothetical protein DCX14_01610, partial [Flavobacteriales bacterium]|nr:hypothetical protein [Flavobacteriales bacterium]